MPEKREWREEAANRKHVKDRQKDTETRNHKEKRERMKREAHIYSHIPETYNMEAPFLLPFCVMLHLAVLADLLFIVNPLCFVMKG